MENIKKYLLQLTICGLVLLVGCTAKPPYQNTSLDDSRASLNESMALDQDLERKAQLIPKSVSEAMLPSVNQTLTPRSEHRFDVVADKMPAKIFFTGLVEGTPYNMLVSPDVTGTITLNLKKVTIEEAMDAVSDMYGYNYHRTSYGYEVLPPTMETQIFTVNYLDVKRVGKSSTSISSGEMTTQPGTSTSSNNTSNNNSSSGGTSSTTGPIGTSVTGTIDTSSEVNFWADLSSTLKNMVGTDKGRSIVVNPQASVVIIHAYPGEIHQVSRYLERIQSNLQRQVILEAKIIEVTLSDGFQAGIDWSLFGNPNNGGTALLSQTGNNVGQDGAFTNTNLTAFDSIFTINYKGAFQTLMRFLGTQGNVQVLSSPRISTVNNQKAVIKVGQDEFFVTGVSTSNTVVGAATIPSQQVNLTPFFSGITLDVTPQISKNGAVILHIHPAVSEVTNQQKTVDLGTNGTGGSNNLTLPLALSTIRESDNIVRAQNGQVVVIGGLMQNSMVENIAGAPGISKIPFIGALFRRTSQVATKTELVILLRPILVNNKVLVDSFKRSDAHLRAMNRGFHLGDAPEVWGTEGEVLAR